MKYLLLLLMTQLLIGCAVETTNVKTAGFEDSTPRPPADYSNGSIWQPASSNVTEDFKARRRGDIVTIVITEIASASKEAKTDTSRDSSMSAGISNFFGLETKKIRVAPNTIADLASLINASASSSFAGAGSTSRQENLSATITARVVDVMPSGNLLIEGRRNVKVNEEDQIIVLEGTIRPRDIAADNTVNSIYIADARISYSGRGIISDRQKPGWFMNFIDKIWPF